MATEFWTPLFDLPDRIAELAAEREEQGWTGLTFGDTPINMADPYVLMTIAASATKGILLATSTTNPVSRDVATTASAISTVQEWSGGRAVLGIGRGDSAVANLGRPPTTTAELSRALGLLRPLLRGGRVRLPLRDDEAARTATWESGLVWRGDQSAPVPIDLYGSGSRTIDLAGRAADRLTVSVGADPARIRWAIERAHATQRPTGLGPLRIGAVINVAPHPDLDTALGLAVGYAATHARFSAMSGRAAASMDHLDAREAELVARSYQMRRHGSSQAAHAGRMSTEFLARFVVAGPPEGCIERLGSLVALGLDHLLLIPPGREGNPAERERSLALLNTEVLAGLRQEERCRRVTS